MKIKIISAKSLASVIAAAFALSACFLYGSQKAGFVFAVLFLCVGIWHIEKESIEAPRVQAASLAALFVLYSFITVFLCQRVLNEGTLEIGFLRILLNSLICLISFMLLYIVTLRPRLSVFLVSCVFVLFTTANYYVFLFRGSEINPADLLSIGTAANVAAEYKVIPNGPVVYAWLLLLFSWFILFSLPIIKITRKIKVRLNALFLVLFCTGTFIYASRNIQIFHFMQRGSVMNGYLLNFALQIRETVISPPEGYSTENISLQEAAYVEKKESVEELPDIFVVMDESFSDLKMLGSEIQTNIDVIPFISSLEDNTIKGYALSSVFGGGTPNSEYEFLSGNSMFFLPTGAIVYQQYIKEPAHSMISDFKDMDYYCVAMHPYLANGWERERVYPLLDYDECFFLNDYPREKKIRDFVSDQEAFEVMLREYEEIKAEKDQNTFMFLVTMQNHGAYTYEGDDFEKTIELNNYNNKYPDAEQYLTLIHETDTALSWLIDCLKGVDHEVVLVFYGDHLPKLDERFYQEIHGGEFDTLDEQNLLQTVPFFIWTNFDIEEETVGLTSLNFLSNYMYKAAGMELPAYNQFLSYIEGTVPAMNAMGYYSKESGCFRTYEEAEGNEAAVLNEYHQFVFNCMFDSKARNSYFFPTEE